MTRLGLVISVGWTAFVSSCCFGLPGLPGVGPAAATTPPQPQGPPPSPAAAPLPPAVVLEGSQRVEGDFGSLVVSGSWRPLPPGGDGSSLRWGTVSTIPEMAASVEVRHYQFARVGGGSELPPTAPPGYAIATATQPTSQDVAGISGLRWNVMNSATGSFLPAGQAMAWSYGDRHYELICLSPNPEYQCPGIFASLRPPPS